MNGHRDVDSTSTSSNKQECIGSHAKEHSSKSRMVWQRLNEIWRLVERDMIIPQE